MVRSTIYVHFPTRESLLDAVTDRAIAEVADVIAAAEPEHGAASEALQRVVAAAWRTLGRLHALVAINTRLSPEELHRRHQPVLAVLAPLIERGQRDGTFRSDVSVRWHLTMMLALVHAASAEVHAGRVDEGAAERAVIATVTGALGAPPWP